MRFLRIILLSLFAAAILSGCEQEIAEKFNNTTEKTPSGVSQFGLDDMAELIEPTKLNEPTKPAERVKAVRRDGPTGPVVGYLAPDAGLVDLTEKHVNLSDFTGTPTVLNFWVSWCGACQLEMPYFNAVAQKYTGKINVIGINVGEGLGLTKSFANRFGLNFPVLSDNTGEAGRQYRVNFFPTTYFIGRDGTIKQIRLGELNQTLLEQYVTSIYP